MPEPVPWTLRGFMRRHPWWSVAVVLSAFSLVLVLWARTRPSYDAYGWLVWGYQSVHGSLDLGGAPSWKPLPFLFTVPYALFGHYQLWLWMVTDAAASFAGAIFAGRIAYRLAAGRSGPGSDGDVLRRYAPIAAAIFAGCGVLGMEDYMHYILSAQSDPVIVTLCLAAIDMHLIGRYRWTLWLGVLAALGRPEVWPFVGLWGLWAWVKLPSIRWHLYAGALVVVFMWFGIPTITNGQPDIAGQLAQGSPRELHSNRLVGVLGRFRENEYLPIWIAAGIGVALAALRRNWAVLTLFAGAAGWVVIEIAFAYHGWPGLSRYMFEPAAVASVIGGVGLGWLVTELPRLRVRIPGWVGIARWAGLAGAAALLVALVPIAVDRLRAEHSDLRHERARTGEITLLQTTTRVVGGAEFVGSCGQPVTDVAYVSALAWLYHRDVGAVGGLQQHIMAAELANKALPKVLIEPLPQGGWSMQPWHTAPAQVTRCHSLFAEYALTPQHPGGVLIRR